MANEMKKGQSGHQKHGNQGQKSHEKVGHHGNDGLYKGEHTHKQSHSGSKATENKQEKWKQEQDGQERE